jgi:hypothetical protein
MGLIDKLSGKKSKRTLTTKSTTLDNARRSDLTKEEVNIVLQLIRSSNFNGDLIEPLYKLTVKLQKMYERL